MYPIKQRLSQAKKNANDKQWYKENIDYFINTSVNSFTQTDSYVNYNLYNGKLDLDDFVDFCNPYGLDTDKNSVVHRDIVSTKIKILIGIDSLRPFEYGLTATSEDILQRKINKQQQMVSQYVVDYVTQDIKTEVEQKYQEQFKGKQLSQEEQQQIQQQIEQEVQSKSPEYIDRFMNKEYKDEAEILGEHLINYVMQKENVEQKLQDGLLHEALSSKGIYYVGIINDEVVVRPTNPLHFAYGLSSDSYLLEDAEYQVAWFDIFPSEATKYFGDELTNDELDQIYANLQGGDYTLTNPTNTAAEGWNWNDDSLLAAPAGTIRVYHVVFRSLRKIGFLSYVDLETGVVSETIVPETYKFNPEVGDVDISWEWIPDIHEGWRIRNDIYVKMQPVEGQFKDLDNLFYSPMPYRGVVHDSINSNPVSIMDRMKPYQYLYDIVMTKLEKLIYSDKGKKIFMNLNMIPQSDGIDLDDFLTLLDKKDIGFLNPNEEGNRGDPNIGSNVKEVDMSYAGDIQRYIALAQYINERIGESIGVSKEMEGQFQNRQAVTNAQQAILQSNKILRPFFALHDAAKRSVIKGILENAKVLYSTRDKAVLKYITNDLQSVMLEVDPFLLDSSTYDVFVNNNDKIYDIRVKVENLAHAALQNQMIDMEAVIKVMKANSLAEAQQYLIEAKDKTQKLQQQQVQQQSQSNQQLEDIKHKNKLDEIKAEGETRIEAQKVKGEYDLQKQAMLSTGFNEDKDMDKDGIPDVLEIYKKGKDVEIKERKQKLDEEKFKHQKEMDKEKLDLEKKKTEKNK